MAELELFTNYSFAGFMFELIPAVVDFLKTTKDKVPKFTEQRKQEMKKSVEYEQELTPNILHDIEKISNGTKIGANLYCALAEYTNKWIAYAMYYMTTYNTNLLTNGVTRQEKEFVNGIAELAGYGKIYQDADVANIEKYDSHGKNDNYKEDFLLDYPDLKRRLVEDDFIQKWHAKKSQEYLYGGNTPRIDTTKLDGPNCRVDENGYIHPLFFNPVSDNSTIVTKRDACIDEETFNRFEKVLSQYINPNDKYYYTKDQDGNFNLVIQRNKAMAEDRYIIDDGSIMGGTGIYILANYDAGDCQDSLFVNATKFHDIVSLIINNKFFIIKKEDAEFIMKTDQFQNPIIYHHIDMTNTQWLDSLNASEKVVLEKSILAAIKVLDKSSDTRLRFLEYTNPVQFTLVSDIEVKSTLSRNGVTASAVENGLRIDIYGDNMIKYYGGQGINYRIERNYDN